MMNQDQAQGTAAKLSSKIKQTWGKLSDSDIALADGKRDQFFTKVQSAYGLSKEDVEKRFAELEKSCGPAAVKAA